MAQMANLLTSIHSTETQSSTCGRSRREYKELVNGKNFYPKVALYRNRDDCYLVNILGRSENDIREYHGKSSISVTESNLTSVKSDSIGKSCDDDKLLRLTSNRSVLNIKKSDMRDFRVPTKSFSTERLGGREKSVGGTHAVKLPLPCVNDPYGSAPLCSKLAHECKSNSNTDSHRRTNCRRAQMSVTNSADSGQRSKSTDVIRDGKNAITANKTRVLKRQFAVRVNSNDSGQSRSSSLNRISLPAPQSKVQQSKNSAYARTMTKQTETNNNGAVKDCCKRTVAPLASQPTPTTRKQIIRKDFTIMSPSSLEGRSRTISHRKPITLTTTSRETSNKERILPKDKLNAFSPTSTTTTTRTKATIVAKKADTPCKKELPSRNLSGSVNTIRKMNENRSPRKKTLQILKPMESYMQICEGAELELSVHIEGAKEVVWVKDATIIKHFPPDFLCVKETKVHSHREIYKLKIADTFVEDSGIYICEVYGVEREDDVICWCKVDVIAMEPEDSHMPSLKNYEDLVVTPQVRRPSLPLVNSEALVLCQEQALDVSTQDLSDECKVLDRSVQVHVAPISSNFSPDKESNIVNRVIECSISSDKSKEEESSEESSAAIVVMAQEACLAQEVVTAGKQEDCIPLVRNQVLSILPAQSPKIVMGPTNLIALYGETIHLRVKMQSFDLQNTTVTWSKFFNGSYKLIQDISESALAGKGGIHISTNNEITTLTMEKITYNCSGKYLVTVANAAGKDSHLCILTVEGPPEPPTSPPDAKYNPVTNAILLAWTGSPYDGGSAVTGYYVEFSTTAVNETAETETWTLLTPQSSNWLCYTVAEPKPNLTYQFRIRAVNAYGKGEPSIPSERIFVSSFTESNGSNRSGSRQSSLQNYCSEGDEEDHLDSDLLLREYKNVTMKCEPFLDHYEKHEELGKGRFGIVFRVVQKSTSDTYAGKFIKCIKSKDKERVHLEFNIMNDLKYHAKLLCLIDGFEMSREIVIITERINGGELFERVVADDFTLTEHDCIDFLRQICAGVDYIHSKNIMHLDLKPENILCTTKTSNQIKIIDFGLAQYYNPTDPIRVLFGTAEFVSPEIINYDIICPSTDMWSIGVITYILLSGLSPFMGDNDNETFSNITVGEFDFDDDSFENVSEDAKDFISSLIVKRKEKRLTAVQCLEHTWLLQSSDSERKDIIIPTDKLKRFLVRRKWQKTGNAIRALGRITTLYSSRRSSSASSTASSPSYSPLMRSFSTQESTDVDNVFINTSTFTPIQSPLSQSPCKEKTFSSICEGPVLETNGINSETNEEEIGALTKARYNESCRSDSGICDVVVP